MDTRLFDAASHILDFLETKLTAAGIQVPDRRYVHAGIPAQDLTAEKCADALIVSWIATSQGQIEAGFSDTPQAAIRCAMPLSAQFLVALYRCVPTFGPGTRLPAPETMTNSAEEILVDGFTLAAVVVDGVVKNGDLISSPIEEVGIGSVSAVGPNGGLGGTHMTLFTSLL